MCLKNEGGAHRLERDGFFWIGGQSHQEQHVLAQPVSATSAAIFHGNIEET